MSKLFSRLRSKSKRSAKSKSEPALGDTEQANISSSSPREDADHASSYAASSTPASPREDADHDASARKDAGHDADHANSSLESPREDADRAASASEGADHDANASDDADHVASANDVPYDSDSNVQTYARVDSDDSEEVSDAGTSDDEGELGDRELVIDRSRPVPLNVIWGTHYSTDETADLLHEVGGRQKIREMVSKFYEIGFEDAVFSKFVEDPSEPHGERLGDWITEKMGGEGDVWTSSRPPNSRTRSHIKAWHSERREPERRGRRFKLDDCRIWMRLMFWAAREIGLADEHPRFFEWYVKFIGHFIAVYERSAPPFAAESAAWSANPDNIQTYIDNGRRMGDVIGRHVRRQRHF